MTDGQSGHNSVFRLQSKVMKLFTCLTHPSPRSAFVALGPYTRFAVFVSCFAELLPSHCVEVIIEWPQLYYNTDPDSEFWILYKHFESVFVLEAFGKNRLTTRISFWVVKTINCALKYINESQIGRVVDVTLATVNWINTSMLLVS